MRHFIRNQATARSFISSNTHLLVIRSLDVVLDNKLERLHAFRLVRKLLSLIPQEFPPGLCRCLVSISREGLSERDGLTRSCWATIAEIGLQNPFLASETGCFSALIDSILQTCQPASISEAVLGNLLFMLNEPSLRHLLREDQDLQSFIAAFTDCYSSSQSSAAATIDHNLETNEQRELRFLASKRALLTILRSWPGLVYFCRSSIEASRGPNGLLSIIQTLHMPYDEGRRHVLDLLYDLLNLEMPTSVSDLDYALDSLSSRVVRDSWQIYDGFVAAEGKDILPHISRTRINLFDNYLSLLLYCLISYGLLDALIQVIIRPRNPNNAIRATILLGEVLHLASRLLPPEVYRKCHSLPELMDAATSISSSPQEKAIASTAICALERIHCFRREPVQPQSLFLEQQLRFVHSSDVSSHFQAKSLFHLKQTVLHESEYKLHESIRDTNVLSHDSNSWNWNLISNILSWPSDSCIRLDDTNIKSFLRKLLLYFRPSSRFYSQVDANHERGRPMTSVCCHFIEFLLMLEESKASEFLEDFVSDIAANLNKIIAEDAPPNIIFSSTKLLTTLSHNYFLIIGRMTASNRGKRLLERLAIFDCLSKIIKASPHDVYAKLIISSLDYTKEGNCRSLLSDALSCSNENTRLYATNFLRVLLRAGVTDFKKWAVELLVQQARDVYPSVSLAAIDILSEACDDEMCLDALVTFYPSILQLGDPGELIFIRLASSNQGLEYLRDNQVLDGLLQKWNETYSLKYVKLVEDTLNEGMTLHFRSECGTYGRRSDRRLMDTDIFAPPHLYGQLAHTEEGLSTIQVNNCLSKFYDIIRKEDLSTELKRVEVKAALWAVGHVGSTRLGWRLIDESHIISDVVRIASECAVLSIRGTAFYTLCLLSMTEAGISQLRDHGWQGLRHRRGEIWPLVLDFSDEDHSSLFRRKQTVSISSVSTTHLIDDLDLRRRKESGLREMDEPPSTDGSIILDTRSRTSSAGVHLTTTNIPEESELTQAINLPNGQKEDADGDSTRRKSLELILKESSEHRNRKISSEVMGYNPFVLAGGALTSLTTVVPVKSKLTTVTENEGTSPISPTQVQACFTSYRLAMPLLSSPGDFPQTSLNKLPTSTDASGYATLRAITRHRVHSLSQHPVFSEIEPTSDRGSGSTSPTSIFDSPFENYPPYFHTVHLPLRKFSDRVQLNEAETPLPEDTRGSSSSLFVSPSSPRCFMGIVIPVSLDLIFQPPPSLHPPDDELLTSLMESRLSDDLSTAGTTILDELTDDREPLELHTNQNCLLCYRVCPADYETACSDNDIKKKIMSEECISTIKSCPPKLLTPKPLKTIISSSVTSSSSLECGRFFSVL